MCSGNDSGNFVMQKNLWCDILYTTYISYTTQKKINNLPIRIKLPGI